MYAMTINKAEIFEDLLITKEFRVERIISNGHASPKDFWYDQEQNEWVMILQGQAILVFRDGDKTMTLKSGDYIKIPAHKQHRVEWTDPEQETVWLAIHYK